MSVWAGDPNFGGSGSSGNTQGGGSRGNCPALAESMQPLTALIPHPKANQSTSGKAIETVSARPTVWVYVPYTAPTAKRVTLILETAEGEEIYRSRLPIPAQPGIVGIALPENQPALEPGKSYQWKYLLSCSSGGDAPEKAIGQIKRIPLAPTLEQQLAQAKTAVDRSRAYVQAGIWYEALTTLGNELKQKPDDPMVKKEWSTLLNYSTVNLGEFALQPLLP
ncbi:MAG: hypothetical protein B0A82_08315 [Alkalinema sp. CACIAM 70d]|nr:MAG: hypothetical protein B0A82_08315 [Alkalinema sp. CACIAM 70d]